MPTQYLPTPRRGRTRSIVLLVLVSAFCGLTASPSPPAAERVQAAAPTAMHEHHEAPMTDAAMQQWVDDWYAEHGRRGRRVGGVPAANFKCVQLRIRR
jgi:hypothetical protein